MEMVVKYNVNRSQVEATFIGPTNDRITYILDLPITTNMDAAIYKLAKHKFDGRYPLSIDAILYVLKKIFVKLDAKDIPSIKDKINKIRLGEVSEYFN